MEGRGAMHVAIVASHYPVASGRYAAAALRGMGVRVTTVGPAMGARVWGLTLDERYVWTPDAAYTPEDADLVIVMDSDPAVLDASFGAVSHRARVVVWGVDNHVRDYRRPWIDHYYVAHRAVSLMPWREDMTHLPCAQDPTWFTPSPIPWEAREWDVCLIGVLYPQRAAALAALARAGLKVCAGTGLVYDQMRDAYWNSRVSLCVSAAGDVAQRIYETAAMGCAVLSDPLADLEGRAPVACFQDEEGLVAQARALQARPELGAAAARWAAGETWAARGRIVLSYELSLEREDGGRG